MRSNFRLKMEGTGGQDVVEEEGGGGDYVVVEPIYARHAKLRSILTPRRQRRGRSRHDNAAISSGLEDFSVEVLLDSFLALYDSWDKTPCKGSYEQFFVTKCKSLIDHLNCCGRFYERRT